jgi:hypothetical protein
MMTVNVPNPLIRFPELFDSSVFQDTPSCHYRKERNSGIKICGGIVGFLKTKKAGLIGSVCLIRRVCATGDFSAVFAVFRHLGCIVARDIWGGSSKKIAWARLFFDGAFQLVYYDWTCGKF